MKNGSHLKVCVLGAGTMGRGIAQVAAVGGAQVQLFDVDKDILAKAVIGIGTSLDKAVEKKKLDREEAEKAKKRIKTQLSLSGVKADLFIEAVLEDLDLKKKLFSELERNNSEKTILATNTSSIPVTSIAKELKNPGRVVGMHFFNPAQIMKLVEVISGAETEPEVASFIFDLCKEWGKTPIMVKDSPGFVVNRVLGPYMAEAVYLANEGVSLRAIDDAAVQFGMPMGPVELADTVGLDVAAKVSEVLGAAFNREPPSQLAEFVAARSRWPCRSD